MPVKRIFLIVLDSFGIGNAPDAEAFGDKGADTLRSVSGSEFFNIPNLTALGLPLIEGADCAVFEKSEKNSSELCKKGLKGSAVCRLVEKSKGKDTTIGHWEIAGIVSEKPLPVYPEGFSDDVIEEFSRRTGRKVLCNKPYSGTEVIKDYGEEHVKTGALIVYTSADSVFQIAAHEDVVPVEKLYEYCEIAREMLVGENSVGRVIARPFEGEHPYKRTSRRHDYSLEPPEKTVLDMISEQGKSVISVGKIKDIFAGKGITEAVPTSGNADGMEKALQYAKKDFEGLCFINLVDFDSSYGHRNDVDGYAKAISEFDRWLPELFDAIGDEDVVMITADHGCDPGFPGTDHTRECVPFIMFGGEKNCSGKRPCVLDLGTKQGFDNIAATVAELLDVKYDCDGNSLTESVLLKKAREVADNAYAPYSGFNVGAVALGADGKIYTGCNVENASYGATVCAERVAVSKAVSDGCREIKAIAVVGGKNGDFGSECAPCGICRQFLAEFCEEPEELKVLLTSSDGNDEIKRYSLSELLPKGFGKKNLN